MTRIVIADDHALVLAGIRKMLESEPDFCVVGGARTADEAVSLTLALRPDILLLDVAMPGKSGLDALEEVAHPPGLHTVPLTAGVDEAERAWRSWQPVRADQASCFSTSLCGPAQSRSTR